MKEIQYFCRLAKFAGDPTSAQNVVPKARQISIEHVNANFVMHPATKSKQIEMIETFKSPAHKKNPQNWSKRNLT
jgi:hypothetical protein